MKKRKKISKKKIKKKTWKYITLVFIVVGISLLGFSAFPIVISHVPSTISNTVPYDIDLDEFDIVNAERIGILADPPPETLDQWQDVMNCDYQIGAGGYWMAQSVKNYREPLTAFVVGLARHGLPLYGGLPAPIYIGIMDPLNDPHDPRNFDYIGYIMPSDIPEDEFHWIGKYPLDISIPANTFFGVVVISESSDPDSGYWLLAANDANPYDRGVLGCRNFVDHIWNCEPINDCKSDMCFATYTIEGDDPPPDPPVITITSTYTIITQFFGGLSLIAAVVTGSKFFFM